MRAACHSTAVTEAEDAFFGTDDLHLTLDSRVIDTTCEYDRFYEAVKDAGTGSGLLSSRLPRLPPPGPARPSRGPAGPDTT